MAKGGEMCLIVTRSGMLVLVEHPESRVWGSILAGLHASVAVEQHLLHVIFFLASQTTNQAELITHLVSINLPVLMNNRLLLLHICAES